MPSYFQAPFTAVKRIAILATIAAILAALATATAVARGGGSTLQLRKTSVGTILVNSRGFTVYAFTKDTRNHDACVAISGCPKVWPPVTATGKPTAGKGVKQGLLGTIKLANGKRQVTYAGHPLYTYVADKSPGQTSYVNVLQFGGRWPALNAAGGEVK
jgi:predicted lipoprotein with Yx(FWY)xxD motif